MNDIQDRINVNEADEQMLADLLGVGDVLARRIIEFRETVHPFEEVIELTAVPGISERMVRSWGDRVTVGTVAPAGEAPEASVPAESLPQPAPEESGEPAGVVEADSTAGAGSAAEQETQPTRESLKPHEASEGVLEPSSVGALGLERAPEAAGGEDVGQADAQPSPVLGEVAAGDVATEDVPAEEAAAEKAAGERAVDELAADEEEAAPVAEMQPVEPFTEIGTEEPAGEVTVQPVAEEPAGDVTVQPVAEEPAGEDADQPESEEPTGEAVPLLATEQPADMAQQPIPESVAVRLGEPVDLAGSEPPAPSRQEKAPKERRWPMVLLSLIGGAILGLFLTLIALLLINGTLSFADRESQREAERAGRVLSDELTGARGELAHVRATADALAVDVSVQATQAADLAGLAERTAAEQDALSGMVARNGHAIATLEAQAENLNDQLERLDAVADRVETFMQGLRDLLFEIEGPPEPTATPSPALSPTVTPLLTPSPTPTAGAEPTSDATATPVSTATSEPAATSAPGGFATRTPLPTATPFRGTPTPLPSP